MALKPLKPGELAERIDAVDWDINGIWHTTDAPPLTFTFRFESAPVADFPWTDVSGFSAWTDAKKATVTTALARYDAIINVDFVEEVTSADPDLSFYLASNGLFGGRGRFRYSGDDWDGSAVFNSSRTLGASDLDLVLHEIGHTLGLKHTGNYDVGGNLPPGPFLPEAEDNTRYSIMSYTTDPALGEIAELGVYDIAALQARFGANMSHAAGRNTYTGPQNGILETIWDGGGIDTLSARGSAQSVQIDLRGGAFSDLGAAGEIAIAYGAVIENAIGGFGSDTLRGNGESNRMTGGAGDDRITAAGGDDFLFGKGDNDTLLGGRGADRFKGGTGNDVMKGGGGDDRFFADPGNDRIFGGKGTDTYIAKRDLADVALDEIRNGVWRIDDGSGRDMLSGIERIVFLDDVLSL